jgi:hypothetical protein
MDARTGMTDKAARDLCMALLRSETEEEVITQLLRAGFWEARNVWRPYGDIANNRGVVGNQQSSPVAALVEKLVNSIDAVLTAECLAESIDPTGPDAPRTMQEAAEELFEVPNGRIERLRASERTRLAESIQLIACGTRDQPAYLIVDRGEGQFPADFPTTFLSLLRENKTRIPFVQGKFNMGGTGVLQFAGSNSFQLILSRRRPDLVSPASNPDENRWGFTIVRRLDPAGDQPQSTYVYLAPDGVIPSFPGNPIDVLPGEYPELYRSPLEAGTGIKIWNYKFPGRLKTIATLDLRRALEEYLQDPALPIRIRERRHGYRAHTFDTTMSGLRAVLADSPDRIEPGFDTGGILNVPGVGSVEIRLVVSKEEGTDRGLPAGVYFNVNGQLHGQLPPDFTSRRTKLDYVASSVLAMIDCTALPARVREDLFLASRDRMRQCEERSALEDAIVGYLADHPGLRQLNNSRRQARIAARLTGDEPLRVVQALARADPTIAALFGKGALIKVPGKEVPVPVPYAGKEFPTFFKPRQDPPGGLTKQCPKNRTCRLEYETDATNDYFSRTLNPGRLDHTGTPVLLSTHLWNGRATLRFGPSTSASVGDVLGVSLEVTDVSRDHPFNSRFKLEVEPEAPPEGPGGPPKPPGANQFNMPTLNEIHRPQWLEHGFDEYSTLDIRSGEDDTLDFFINMDNINLRNEIGRRKDRDPKVLEYWFKYGILLLALGIIYRGRQRRGDQGDDREIGSADEDSKKLAVAACDGLAVTLIPTISQLGQGIPE